MKRISKNLKKILALVLCVANILTLSTPAMAEEVTVSNIALGAVVTASAQYGTMPASYAVDGDLSTRWSSEAGPEQWLQVDLGVKSEIHGFTVASEAVEAQKIGMFKIEGSNDGTSFTVIHQSEDKSAEGFDLSAEVTLDEVVEYRYVKITIQKLKTGAYPSVSLREFAIKGIKGEIYQDPSENVALGKNVVASSIEADSLSADKATDGNYSTRWASKYGLASESDPHWIYVNLGSVMNVKTIRMKWEYRKASAYKIQTATALTGAESDWTDVKVINGRPSAILDTIVLDEAVKAQYVRVYVTGSTSEDPDGGVAWPTISIYELEVYGGAPPITLDEIMDDIQVKLPEAGEENKLQVTLPNFADYDGFVDIENADNYEIKYNGTDYEQVIGTDLTIYTPVVDTNVKVSFKVTNEETGAYQFKEVEVTVPGTYTQAEGDNAAPEVVPELREWKGTTGTFTATDSSRIVIASSELQEMADVFAADYKEITGNDITVVTGTEADAVAGDFYFALTTDTTKGLQKEGYLMEIADVVKVESETTTGAFWATRTILQSIKLTGNLPKGITRDYPLYEVRGYILDVGRKTFTMDHLVQMVKEMAWYKMNDFQIHLNDNLIPLENYSQRGEDPMQAYSGFRLESDIKKGGTAVYNGTEYTYSEDLTSKDVYYTKAEFKDLIETARVYGVNIIPEIDTPAHSLALTRVLPELRHGTWGRDNDHLALATKYGDCLEYVQDIFNEYMGADLSEDELVFDEDTIIHVGADEYSAAPEAYRKFADDMLKYVQESGRVARIWGSLSSIQGSTPVRAEGVQMNLWNFGWANMDKMYEEGFDLINCNDGNYYIVPNAGYYYDYLSDGVLYNQALNSIGGVTIPAGDAQMIGGAIAVWNDMTDYLDNGISEYDVYDRIKMAIPLFGAKLWGKHDRSLDETKELVNELGDAPGTNFGYDVEHEGDEIAHYTLDDTNHEALAEVKNAAIAEVDGKQALKLEGGESYVATDFTTVGLSNDLRVKVKRTSDSNEDQILFESEYGTIKAVQGTTGKVGFTRENYNYSFNYTLPVNEWVELEFKNEFEVMQLYVNGVLVDTIGDDEVTQGRPLLATMMIPFARIGSTENSFIGYVEDVRLGVSKTYNSTMELDKAVTIANAILAYVENEELQALIADANAIFAQFDPSAEEISALANSINEIVAEIEYQEANYDKVDTYLALIEKMDLAAYTGESVATLTSVAESIQTGLPAGMQDTVDSYAMALRNAIHALEVKPATDVYFVDNATIKATASSNQDGGSAPGKAIDGDPSTIWHTKWSITTMPHWINFELAEKATIEAITYVPRSGGGNGNLKEYIIKVSDDGVNYTDHATGTLAENGETKVIEFAPVNTKHIQVYYVQATANFGSAAEFKLHRGGITADTEGLEGFVAQIKELLKGNFTDDSWDALQAKIAEAESLLAIGTTDANEVEAMKRALAVQLAMLDTENDVVVDPDPTPDPDPVPPTQEELVRSFVERMYTIILGRDADPNGLSDWAAGLIEWRVDGAGIVNGFANSEEFVARNLSDEDFIKTLYLAVLNREADAAGLADWLRAFELGQTRQQLIDGFVTSAEFIALCDSYGILAEITQRHLVTSFVERMYTVALDREADAAGLEYWVTKLMAGQADGKTVVNGFVGSPEFEARGLSDEEFIKTLYRTILGREASDADVASWIAAIELGQTRTQIMNGFIESAEFAYLCDGYGISAILTQRDLVTNFVSRMYTVALNREADANGLNDWVTGLIDGVIYGAQVADGFIMSAEFEARGLSDADYVKTLYMTFFNREASEADVEGWVAAMTVHGQSRRDVMNGFINSAEFEALCNEYGIIRGVLA